MDKVYVDNMLVHYGEEMLWDEAGQKRKKSGSSDVKLPKLPGGGAGAAQKAQMAQKVREHVAALVRQAPQAVVKVTGGGADMRRIGSHIDYIARAGQYKKKGLDELEIETDEGTVVQGAEARARLKDMFAYSGTPIPQEVRELPSDTVNVSRKRREALNVVLSMPHGISRELVKAAARATAQKLFAKNHIFAMVHHEDTDHQHTHVCVKMEGHDGKRLNPRKADLENWRIAFAKELNLRGVDAVATRRRVRFQRQKGESQAVRQMKDRGAEPVREATAQTLDVPKMRAQANNAHAAKAYSEIAKTLAGSPLDQDRALAKGLQGYLQQQGVSVQLKRQPGIR